MSKDLNDIKDAVDARVQAEAEALKADDKKDGGINSRFVVDCLHANESGDGALFAALHRGRLIFNKTTNQWFRWTGHHWEIDVLEKFFPAVEAVSLKYLEEYDRLSEEIKKARREDQPKKIEGYETLQKSLLKRVKRLRSLSGAQNCLSWAHRVAEGICIEEGQFDREPWLLACKNGVIELKTGRFRDGRDKDFLTKAAPHKWKGIDHPAENWEKFLHDVFGGNKDLVSYVQRLFGYATTGLTSEHVLPVLHGQGRNGKGTLVETLRYVLGSLAQPIQSEMLLDQRNARSSSGPSPDIMALKGLRIAFASETDEGRKFSTSKAKWLSGGDTLTGRNPHDRYETTFEPTHLLCLLTNHLPHADGTDFAFWQRVHLIPFKFHFVENPKGENERPRDKDLPEKLKGEAPGILAWLVRGCIEWQRQGLNPPPVVRSATEQYRISEDLLAEFLAAHCEPLDETAPEARTQFKELYELFEKWFGDTIGDAKYCPKKKKFSQLMEKKFKKVKAGGVIWFYGVSLRPGGGIGD